MALCLLQPLLGPGFRCDCTDTCKKSFRAKHGISVGFLRRSSAGSWQPPSASLRGRAAAALGADHRSARPLWPLQHSDGFRHPSGGEPGPWRTGFSLCRVVGPRAFQLHWAGIRGDHTVHDHDETQGNGPRDLPVHHGSPSWQAMGVTGRSIWSHFSPHIAVGRAAGRGFTRKIGRGLSH